MPTAELSRSPFEGALVGWLLQLRPTVARLPVAVLSDAEKAAELRRLQARRAMDA
ncbi:HNH endonuclease, partial [Blastococcus sp. KM273128]|nr:HNH endonuclease [Blastococcus sp. KM273128]